MHRWFGLILCLFLIGFCVSGVILNHHEMFSSINVSRSLMPNTYEYKDWNQGLMRGTIAKGDSVIIYGENGFFLTNKLGTNIKDFNKGMPSGVEMRNIRSVTRTRSGDIWAVGNFQLYHLESNNVWETVELDGLDSRLTDVTSRGDSVVVVSRNHIWLSPNTDKPFRQIQLRAGTDYDGKVSLLRTIWLIHSGALFGTIGKIIGDAVAIILIILSISGVWFFIARKSRAGKSQLKTLYWIHRRIGRITIVLTLFVTITGWFLRPPAMIAIVKGRVHALPLSVQSSNNPWNDQLRAARYDFVKKDWLIYTSNGFYVLQDLFSTPRPVSGAPNVSFMGLSSFYQVKTGQWLIGSFSGLYLWNRDAQAGAPRVLPIDKDITMVGFSNDFKDPILIDYYKGTTYPKMPSQFKTLPMSLHMAALETHTGRIYTFLKDGTNVFYIAIIGLAIAWCLWTGYYRPRKNRKKNKTVKKTKMKQMNELRIKRIYLSPEKDDGYRLLIDRLWPRGISKVKASLDEWDKTVAPSTELREWFGHEDEKFAEFERKYCSELDNNPDAAQFAQHVKNLLNTGNVTLLYGAKNETCNQAVVLKAWILSK